MPGADPVSILTCDGKNIFVSGVGAAGRRVWGVDPAVYIVFVKVPLVRVHWVGVPASTWGSCVASLAFPQGTLKGFDQLNNVVLENCHERVFSPYEGVEQIVLGLYILRGDNM